MTYLEIDNALIAVTQKICEECKQRLDHISPANTTENKCVQLEYGIYTFCNNIHTTREDILFVRQRYFHNIKHKYPQLDAVYQKLDDDSKLCFIAAIHCELFIRDQWIAKRSAELVAATEAQDTKSIFEIKIMLNAVRRMFAAWEAWRVENNIFPHMFEGDYQ